MDLSYSLDGLYKVTKKAVSHTIKKTFKNYDLTLEDGTFEHLALHLSNTVIRLTNNSYILLTNSQRKCAKKSELYPVVVSLIDAIQDEFDIVVPKQEVITIIRYLANNNTVNEDMFNCFDLVDEDILDIIDLTFENINKKYGIDFSENSDLETSIGLHLEPAIERLKIDNQLNNPLLTEIQEKFPKELEYCQVLNDVVYAKYEKRFTDDELSFVALHFGVETNKEEIEKEIIED